MVIVIGSSDLIRHKDFNSELVSKINREVFFIVEDNDKYLKAKVKELNLLGNYYANIDDKVEVLHHISALRKKELYKFVYIGQDMSDFVPLAQVGFPFYVSSSKYRSIKAVSLGEIDLGNITNLPEDINKLGY